MADCTDPTLISVGDIVQIFSDEHRRYFQGIVTEHLHGQQERFLVQYDVSNEEFVDFGQERFRLLPNTTARVTPGSRVSVHYEFEGRSSRVIRVRCLSRLGFSRLGFLSSSGESPSDRILGRCGERVAAASRCCFSMLLRLLLSCVISRVFVDVVVGSPSVVSCFVVVAASVASVVVVLVLWSSS